MKRTSFSATSTPTNVKKKLYLSLILPILTNASQVWRPFLIKDIKALEQFQRRVTKYIVNDNTTNYKTWLSELNLLPLMYRHEINDIMFFVSNWTQSSNEHFNFKNYIFPTVSSTSQINTRSTASLTCKLRHNQSKSALHRHVYFNILPRLWNKLPPIDITASQQSIKHL